MEISVIIPSYNDGALLARCLHSLLAQDLEPGRWEVVVALDGSTDGSARMLRRGLGESFDSSGPLDACVETGAWRDLPLRVVELSCNQGRSAARNAALNLARGDWRLFLDADLRVGPEWTRSLVSCAGDPNRVAVGEMVYESSPVDPPQFAALLRGDPEMERKRRRDLQPYQRYLETRGPWKHRHLKELAPRYFYTCNSAVHRSLLDRAGPFEEQLRGWGGEDIDMGLRLHAAGGTLVFCNRARALHAQERSFAAHCANLESLGAQGMRLLVERHPELLRALKLDRLLPARLGGRPQPMLVAARQLGLQRLLLALESLHLLPGERFYDLTVYLHYAGAYREAMIADELAR